MADTHTNFLCPENDQFYSLNKYKPLDRSKKEARLVVLYPGSGGSTIECSLLQPISLATSGLAYCALSYCAGDRKYFETIQFEGSAFNVFKPIGYALRRIRQKDRSHCIWVDQLCINQSDVEERGHQVSFMGDIYSGAAETIAWLGHQNRTDAAAAFDFVRRIVDVKNKCMQARKGDDSEESLGQARTREKAAEFDAAREPQWQTEITDTDVRALRLLFRREWWRRCWVLQEVFRSCHVQTIAGEDSLPLKDVVSAFDVLRNVRMIWSMQDAAQRSQHAFEERPGKCFQVLREQLDRALRHVPVLDIIRLRDNGSFLGMLECFMISRRCLASDARDMVYANLGIAQSSERLEPSYETNNTARDVFIDAAKATIDRNDRLDVLALCGQVDSGMYSSLPTWVPDLSPATRHHRVLKYAHTCAGLNEGNSKLWNPKVVTNRHNGLRSDLLDCWILSLGDVANEDSLGVIGNASNRGLPKQNDVQADWWARALKVIQGTLYAPTMEPLGIAFERTLCLGKSISSSSTHGPGEPQTAAEAFKSRKRYHGASAAQYSLKETLCKNSWRFFASPSGYIGIVPAAARHDDTLAVLFEAKIPFVLRKKGASEGSYTLVGQAYIHGIDPTREIKAVYNSGSSEFGGTPTQISIY